jgi:hypothetical protein
LGKPSKLIKQQGRVLYDRDKMPEGLDPEIWHLTLFFDQEAEKYNCSTIGRPIVYTELSTRINASNIRSNFIHWSGIVEDMISRFWAYELDPSRSRYAVSDFCGADTFSYLLRFIVDERARQLLIDSGDRIKQPDTEPQPSKRDEKDSLASEIINKRYTPEELQEKMRNFERRS